MIEFLVISLSLYATLTAFLAMNGFFKEDPYGMALVLIVIAYLIMTVAILSVAVIILWGRQ